MVSRVENQLLLHQVIEDLKRGLTGHFQEKKMQGECNERKKKPHITFKKEQTKKQKQNKTNPWSRFLMSVINSGSASFSIVLKLPLIFNFRSYYDTWAKKVKQSDAIANDHFRLNLNCVTVNIGISSPG